MSQSWRYFEEMDSTVGEIASYYGKKFAEMVWITQDQVDEDDVVEDSYTVTTPSTIPGEPGTSITMCLVNLALRRLRKYHRTVWKVEVGIGGGSSDGDSSGATCCYSEIEDYMRDTLDGLFSNTQNAVISEVIYPKEDVEDGQMVKTEALGELYDSDGVKKALAMVEKVLSDDIDGGVEEVIKRLDECRAYIETVVNKAKKLKGALENLNDAHTKANKIYAELVLFSDGGDIVTHKYNTTPKSKAAINEFNGYLSYTMDRIEGAVPVIIDGQQKYMDLWDMVDSIDPSEIQTNHYLKQAYDLLQELKQEVSDQYLSHEVEDIGSKISSIISYIGYALSDTKTNATHDLLLQIQQRLQLTALDGLHPMNIVNIAGDDDWKTQQKLEYPPVIDGLKSSLKIFQEA